MPRAADVRFGSKADIRACPRHVRFTPKRVLDIEEAPYCPSCPKWGGFSTRLKVPEGNARLSLARGRVCSPLHLTTTAEVLLRADYASAVDGGGLWQALPIGIGLERLHPRPDTKDSMIGSHHSVRWQSVVLSKQ
jgi:hypothetical protein